MKKQIVIIHGGDTFETYEEYMKFLHDFQIDIKYYSNEKTDWKPWLRGVLGDGYEVILPKLPNNMNAKFIEWKIWFEKIIPFLNDEVVLVGHSLGASFLAKYLSENKFSKKIKGVFLVAGVFNTDSEGYSLATFTLPEKLDLQTENVYLYHSKDDPIVPFSQLGKFEEALPRAHSTVFEDRKHFNQESFPEIAENIVNLK
jgi:predicted alpha/beta hydrolase family esterase